MKQYILYAGVNGAGKSTLYQAGDDLDLPRINLDEIVRSFGNWKNPEDVLKAGKIASKLLNEYLDNGISFNQETTLCGRSAVRNIKIAKERGYIVNVYYVGVDSAEIAIERVKQRVLNGGHGVPDGDITRRYYESLDKLIEIVPICDNIQIYDNTVSFMEIAVINQGNCIKISNKCPQWCLDVIDKCGI